MDMLLAKLSEQQATMRQTGSTSKNKQSQGDSLADFPPLTPNEPFPSSELETRPSNSAMSDGPSDIEEVLRLKLQLAQAQTHISKLDHELAQTRSSRANSGGAEIAPARGALGQATRENPWGGDDAQSDNSDTVSSAGFPRSRAIWGHPRASFSSSVIHASTTEPAPSSWMGNRTLAPGFTDQLSQCSASEACRNDRLSPEADLPSRMSTRGRTSRFDSRAGMPAQYGGSFTTSSSQFDPVMASFAGANMGMPPGHMPLGMSLYPQYQQQPIGTPLSPHASEFTSKGYWKPEVSISQHRHIKFAAN